jgi:RIO-like serine/threonine protein kinase
MSKRSAKRKSFLLRGGEDALATELLAVRGEIISFGVRIGMWKSGETYKV